MTVRPPIRCDIRGCEGTGDHRFWTESGEAIDLCDNHRTLIESPGERAGFSS